MLTLCDIQYAMKEQPDINVTSYNLQIFPWTFIWLKVCLNTLSRYGDRALKLCLKSVGIGIVKQEQNPRGVFCEQALRCRVQTIFIAQSRRQEQTYISITMVMHRYGEKNSPVMTTL